MNNAITIPQTILDHNAFFYSEAARKTIDTKINSTEYEALCIELENFLAETINNNDYIVNEKGQNCTGQVLMFYITRTTLYKLFLEDIPTLPVGMTEGKKAELVAISNRTTTKFLNNAAVYDYLVNHAAVDTFGIFTALFMISKSSNNALINSKLSPIKRIIDDILTKPETQVWNFARIANFTKFADADMEEAAQLAIDYGKHFYAYIMLVKFAYNRNYDLQLTEAQKAVYAWDYLSAIENVTDEEKFATKLPYYAYANNFYPPHILQGLSCLFNSNLFTPIQKIKAYYFFIKLRENYLKQAEPDNRPVREIQYRAKTDPQMFSYINNNINLTTINIFIEMLVSDQGDKNCNEVIDFLNKIELKAYFLELSNQIFGVFQDFRNFKGITGNNVIRRYVDAAKGLYDDDYKAFLVKLLISQATELDAEAEEIIDTIANADLANSLREFVEEQKRVMQA